MYDSKRIQRKEPVTLDYILSKVTEYDIYACYLGQFQIGNIYNSPFREDKNPSFGVFRSRKSGKLLFKDHGSGLCGDVIRFVQEMTGLTNYDQLLQKIVDDLRITNKTVLKANKVYQKSDETVIGIVRQAFTNVDKQYWQQFGITLDTLEKFNVHSIKYYLCNGIVKGIYKDENPMYAYKVYNRFKVYRPLGDKYTKWRNNLTEYDIQGYEQLPDKGNLLIITKSMKDVMSLYEMGYIAISPSSESTFIPDKILTQLKSRFNRILVCFDRDSAGVRAMRKIKKKYGLDSFLIHKKFNSKDISDAIKGNSQATIKEWLDNNIKTKTMNTNNLQEKEVTIEDILNTRELTTEEISENLDRLKEEVTALLQDIENEDMDEIEVEPLTFEDIDTLQASEFYNGIEEAA